MLDWMADPESADRLQNFASAAKLGADTWFVFARDLSRSSGGVSRTAYVVAGKLVVALSHSGII